MWQGMSLTRQLTPVHIEMTGDEVSFAPDASDASHSGLLPAEAFRANTVGLTANIVGESYCCEHVGCSKGGRS